MRVLLGHNFYGTSAPSGEDVVFADELSLLRAKGVDVLPFTRCNGSGPAALASAALGALWSRRTYQELRDLLQREKVDVAHFHNIFPHLSPSAYQACHDAGVPVVQTLHNYRMTCANGMLLDSHGPCERCVDDHRFARAIVKGCYRGSRLASLPVVAMQYLHETRWGRYVDVFVALTEFGRRKHIAAGVPAQQIVVKPNFVAAAIDPGTDCNGEAIFIGRLKHEKGTHVLARAWRELADVPLRVLGDGPDRAFLEHELAAAGCKSVVEGQRPFDQCMVALRRASFLVMTSICYEGFPRTICEAYCCGKAVIAPRLGAMAELVEDGVTGLLYAPGDAGDLAAKVRWLHAHPEACAEMGAAARQRYEHRYSADRNFDLVMGIYARARTLHRERNSVAALSSI